MCTSLVGPIMYGYLRPLIVYRHLRPLVMQRHSGDLLMNRDLRPLVMHRHSWVVLMYRDLWPLIVHRNLRVTLMPLSLSPRVLLGAVLVAWELRIGMPLSMPPRVLLGMALTVPLSLSRVPLGVPLGVPLVLVGMRVADLLALQELLGHLHVLPPLPIKRCLTLLVRLARPSNSPSPSSSPVPCPCPCPCGSSRSSRCSRLAFPQKGCLAFGLQEVVVVAVVHGPMVRDPVLAPPMHPLVLDLTMLGVLVLDAAMALLIVIWRLGLCAPRHRPRPRPRPSRKEGWGAV